MDNHPIPQDVTHFQFKLVGNLTLKQFGYVAVGVIAGWITISLPVFFLIKFIIGLAFLGSGLFFAFIPVEGRPADLMLSYFFKAIFQPNQYVFQKQGLGTELIAQANTQQATQIQQPLPPQQFQQQPMQMANQPRVPMNQPIIPQPQLQQVPQPMPLPKMDISSQPTTLPPLPFTSPPPQQMNTIPSVPKEMPSIPVSVPQEPTPVIKSVQQTITPASVITSPAPTQMPVNQPIMQQVPTPSPVVAPVQQMPMPATPIPEPEKPIQEKVTMPQPVAPVQSAPSPSQTLLDPALQTQLQQTLEQKKQLEEQLEQLKKQLAQNNQQLTQTPQQGEQPQQPVAPKAVSPVLKTITPQPKSAQMPVVSDFPNIVMGVIKDSRGNVLPNILVEVKDGDDNPVRAFKTNALGQFASATPLLNGIYTILFEDPGKTHRFDAVQIEVKGEIMQPIEVISRDDREDLRKELFG